MLKLMKAKRIKDNIKIVIMTIAIVLIWRGVWGFCDEYLFPNQKDISYGISIAIGLFLLWLDDFSIDELIRGR